MKRTYIILIGICFILSTCSSDQTSGSAAGNNTYEAYESLPKTAPISTVTGETLSPNERFKIHTAGASDIYVSGERVPKFIQITDIQSGEVVWQMDGAINLSAFWSPDSTYLALSYGGRTWSAVKLIETTTWTEWKFTLPDGSPIPEYMFLPENWCKWQDNNSLQLIIGEGGDSGEQQVYRVFAAMEKDSLTGETLYEVRESVSGEFDFNHDGTPEIVEVVNICSSELPGQTAWYELQVKKTDDTLLWEEIASTAHVEWGSVFSCKIDGQDYLLRYSPWMGQGYATYQYKIFSLSEAGEEIPLKSNSVNFDINFSSPIHESFDIAAITSFLEEVHGYLNTSTLLISTAGGEFRSGGSGAVFREELMGFFDIEVPYDESKSLEENLQAFRNQYE